MEDEEKKAIEILKNYLCETHSKFCKVGAVGIPNEEFYAIEIILNLIEKQQKEIEELKKPKYVMDFKTNKITKLTNDFVSKDKIKAKIKELEKYRDKFYECNMLKDVIIKQNQIQVLQSLLEKE